MTNQTPNPVTDNQVTFTPQAYSPGSLNIDLFGPHQSFYQSREQPRYHYRVQSTGERGKYKGELIIYDFRGGTGPRFGDFNRDFDRSRFDPYSKVDTRFSRSLLLPTKITDATTPDPSGTSIGITWERIFGRLMIGTGSGSGASLFSETSATDPTIVATAYNAASAITAMDGIVVGGATAARMLCISRAGATVQVISDVSGTVNATGHADLNPCWGACQTFLNSDTILFYADNGIYALAKTAAISDAPTLTLSNLPDGGYWLDNEPFKVGGGPYRCYLALPKQDTATGMVPFGSTGDFEIISINQEGFDPVPVIFPSLAKIVWAGRFRQGIIATDGYKIVYYDGERYLDGNPFGGQVIASSYTFEIVGVWIINHDVYIRMTDNQSGTTYYINMYWDVDTDAWHFTSTDASASADPEACRSRGLPWSFNSTFYRHKHWYEGGSWRRQQWVESDENPYYLQMDSSSGNAYEFNSVGDVLSMIWDLPGLEGKPKSITAITFLGDLYNGSAEDNTTKANVTVTAGAPSGGSVEGVSARFEPPVSRTWEGLGQRHEFTQIEVFDKLCVTISIGQGSGGADSTFYTPNALPIKIEFMAWEYPTPGIGQMPSLPLHK
jgi:hypothetical protein